jgi:hypothetical protein
MCRGCPYTHTHPVPQAIYRGLYLPETMSPAPSQSVLGNTPLIPQSWTPPTTVQNSSILKNRLLQPVLEVHMNGII